MSGDTLRDRVASAAYYSEKRYDYGDSWTEIWEDESDSYQGTFYAIADAVIPIIQGAES